MSVRETSQQGASWFISRTQLSLRRSQAHPEFLQLFTVQTHEHLFDWRVWSCLSVCVCVCVMGFELSCTVEREFDKIPDLSCSHVCLSLSTLPHIHVSSVACVSTRNVSAMTCVTASVGEHWHQPPKHCRKLTRINSSVNRLAVGKRI